MIERVIGEEGRKGETENISWRVQKKRWTLHDKDKKLIKFIWKPKKKNN